MDQNMLRFLAMGGSSFSPQTAQTPVQMAQPPAGQYTMSAPQSLSVGGQTYYSPSYPAQVQNQGAGVSPGYGAYNDAQTPFGVTPVGNISPNSMGLPAAQPQATNPMDEFMKLIMGQAQKNIKARDDLYGQVQGQQNPYSQDSGELNTQLNDQMRNVFFGYNGTERSIADAASASGRVGAVRGDLANSRDNYQAAVTNALGATRVNWYDKQTAFDQNQQQMLAQIMNSDLGGSQLGSLANMAQQNSQFDRNWNQSADQFSQNLAYNREALQQQADSSNRGQDSAMWGNIAGAGIQGAAMLAGQPWMGPLVDSLFKGISGGNQPPATSNRAAANAYSPRPDQMGPGRAAANPYYQGPSPKTPGFGVASPRATVTPAGKAPKAPAYKMGK